MPIKRRESNPCPTRRIGFAFVCKGKAGDIVELANPDRPLKSVGVNYWVTEGQIRQVNL